MVDVPIRVQGDPEVIDDVAALMDGAEECDLLRIETDDLGGIGADFALETVATAVGLASALFFDGAIVPSLWRLLRRHKGTTITIETPTRSVSITSSDDLTPEMLGDLVATLSAA